MKKKGGVSGRFGIPRCPDCYSLDYGNGDHSVEICASRLRAAETRAIRDLRRWSDRRRAFEDRHQPPATGREGGGEEASTSGGGVVT